MKLSIFMDTFVLFVVLGVTVKVSGINIVQNIGHASAYNPEGYSESDAFSSAFKAGILYPGSNYRPLAEQSQSLSKSTSTGRRPPSTYANTGAAVGANYGRGNVAAGYSGGQGQSYSKSNAQQIRIPLFGGAVLLSNLPTSGNDTDTDSNRNSSEIVTSDAPTPTMETQLPRNISVTQLPVPTVTNITTPNNRLVFN